MKRLLLISLFVLFSCNGDEVFIDYLHPRQAVTEYTYNKQPQATIPGAVIVTSLESPTDTSSTILDIGNRGVDSYEVQFNYDGKFYYRLQEGAKFSFKLIDKSNNRVVFELNQSKTSISGIDLSAGTYIYQLEIDPKIIDEDFSYTSVFIQPDQEKLEEIGYSSRQMVGKYKNIDIATYISYSSCYNCDLTKADFSYMKLRGNKSKKNDFTLANFKNSKGVTTDLSYSTFNKATFNTAEFDSSNFSHSTFNQILDANYSVFEHSDFSYSEFNESFATYMKFNISNFQYSIIKNSVFSNSEFRATEYQYVKSTDNNFTDCTFRGSSLNNADFSNSILYNADLSYSDIRGAVFCNTVTTFMKFAMVWSDSTTKCWNFK